MKKTVSFILSVMMVLGLFTTALATPFVPSEDFGTAVGDSIEAVTIKNTVENFLGEYNAEVWNGHDSDLTANTAAAIADAAPYALGTVKVVAPSGNVKEQTFNRTSACNYTYVPTEIGYHTVTYSSPNGTKTCYFYAY